MIYMEVVLVTNNIQKLVKKIRLLSLNEECNKTALPYLLLYRHTQSKIKMPQLNNPYIYLVLDGSIRLYTPSGIMDYMAGQYSVSAIDTPTAGYVFTYSKQQDFLALTLEFTLNDVLSTAIDLDDKLMEQIMNSELDTSTMQDSDNNVVDCIYRLFTMSEEYSRLDFIGKHIKKEIVFYILCGSCGKQFLQSITNIQQAGDIYEANSWIKENFKDSFTIESLAEQRSMSVSLFHQRFKNAVGMGPLQCQKRLRLTEARRLMLDESKNVTEASMEVGYGSVSQFTRDYRKMFGKSPKEDILILQKILKK